MREINLGIPVNVWNALKFVLFEALVSLAFAPLWERYIRTRSRRIVYDSDGASSATLFNSEIGRFTPASMMVYRTGAKVHLCACQLKTKHICRGVLLLVNDSLPASLLLTEYGSGSASAFIVVDANVTDISRHAELTKAVSRGELPTTMLAPLSLASHDYEYQYQKQQTYIGVKARVRSQRDESRHLTVRNIEESVQTIGVCGILSTWPPCSDFYRTANVTQAMLKLQESPLFVMRGFQNLSERFKNAAENVSISRGIQEIGAGSTLYNGPKTYEMDCLLTPFNISRLGYETYQINQCMAKVGQYYYFFLMEPTFESNIVVFFHRYQHLKGQSNRRYTAARIYPTSLFGVHSDFIPSPDVALLQLHALSDRLFQYKENLGRSENIYMDYLKERILFALIGMTVGNSAVERVEAEADVKHATLNVFFVSGTSCTLLMLLVLLIAGSQFGSAKRKICAIPVAPEELLKNIREIDCRRSGTEVGSDSCSAKWPEICITQDSDTTAKLSFCGGEPLRFADFPAH